MKLHFWKGSGKEFFTATIVLMTVFVFFAQSAQSEDHPIYGPRFEIGGGIGYSAENLQPRWAPDNNRVCTLTGNIRLFKGLAVQGGVDWSNGDSPDNDSISCGGYLVKINKGTFGNSRWAGLRYELPMKVLHQDIAGIHSIYAATGYTWSEMGVQSTEWVFKGVQYKVDNEHGFRLADMKGPYAVLAARWRIDNPEAERHTTTWLGAYGLDIGVKYNRYSEMDASYPNIAKASDKYHSYQIFMVGFLKFRMFE